MIDVCAGKVAAWVFRQFFMFLGVSSIDFGAGKCARHSRFCKVRRNCPQIPHRLSHGTRVAFFDNSASSLPLQTASINSPTSLNPSTPPLPPHHPCLLTPARRPQSQSHPRQHFWRDYEVRRDCPGRDQRSQAAQPLDSSHRAASGIFVPAFCSSTCLPQASSILLLTFDFQFFHSYLQFFRLTSQCQTHPSPPFPLSSFQGTNVDQANKLLAGDPLLPLLSQANFFLNLFALCSYLHFIQLSMLICKLPLPPSFLLHHARDTSVREWPETFACKRPGRRCKAGGCRCVCGLRFAFFGLTPYFSAIKN